MKKGITILICAMLISITSAMAQNIDINASNFPDTNFRNYLLAQPYGSDDILTPTEIAGITFMHINNMNISDLTGIGFFTALEQLECNSNQLTSLDVSNNTALKNLSCGANQLTSLDVSANTALQWLGCGDSQLTNLNVSGCTALQNLQCFNNQFTSLDVSANTALIILNCRENQLTSLDVSANTALQVLHCDYNQLTSLNVSNNTALHSLHCSNNQITSLDVSANTALYQLSCSSNQLTSLDLSNNIILQDLSCFNNQISQISNLTGLRTDMYMEAQMIQLPLSELYLLTTTILSPASLENGYHKYFTVQLISPQTAEVGVALDWSPLPAQNIFDGNYTEYIVFTGALDFENPVFIPASPSDYTVSNGNITFNTAGTYTIGMSNAAIKSNNDETGLGNVGVLVISIITVSDEGGGGEPPVSGEDCMEVKWANNFGGSDGENYQSVTAVSDGIVAVGYSKELSFGSNDWTDVTGKGDNDAIIVKYDNIGNVVWKKNFGGSDYDQYNSVTAVSDGIVAVGNSEALSFSNGDWTGVTGKGDNDAIIVKYDNAGNIVWKKNFGGSYFDEFYSVTAVSDGIVAVGSASSASFGNGDWVDVTGNGFDEAIIVKYDNSGNVIWKKNFGGNGTDYYSAVTAVADGIVAVGHSSEDAFNTGDWTGVTGNGSTDAIIVKYDNDGNVLWKKNFGGSDEDYFWNVTSVSDGIVAVGYSRAGSFGNGDWTGITGKGDLDAIIVKYDNDGNVVWKKNFGGSDADFYYDVTAVSDGIVAVGNSLESSFGTGDWTGVTGKGGSRSATIVKYDNAGNVVWKNNFGGYSDFYWSVTAISEGFVAVGNSWAASFGNGDLADVTGKGDDDAIIVKYGLCYSEPIEDCEPVTNILNLPSCTSIGNMALIGMVTPTNATNQDIIWSVTGAGASISGTNNDILTTTSTGSVTLTATISDGLCGSDYTQDFNINVLEQVTDVTYAPGVASTGNSFTLGVGLSVTPSTITDYVIAWQVVNAGTTGAKIGGNILKATAGGTVTVRVYVMHNTCGYVMFTKDISITVNDGCCN